MYGPVRGETSALDRTRQRPAFRAVSRQKSRLPGRRGDAPQRESPRFPAPLRISPCPGFMA